MTNLEQLERDVAHVVRRGDELDVERVALELDARRDHARVVVVRDLRGLSENVRSSLSPPLSRIFRSRSLSVTCAASSAASWSGPRSRRRRATQPPWRS